MRKKGGALFNLFCVVCCFFSKACRCCVQVAKFFFKLSHSSRTFFTCISRSSICKIVHFFKIQFDSLFSKADMNLRNAFAKNKHHRKTTKKM